MESCSKCPTPALTIEIKKKKITNYYVLNRQAICFRFSYRNNKDNYKIIATKAAKELVKDDLAWIAEEEAIVTKKTIQKFLYSNSENALA
jgi:hypothetical protein